MGSTGVTTWLTWGLTADSSGNKALWGQEPLTLKWPMWDEEATYHSHLGTDAGRDGVKTGGNSFLYLTLWAAVFTWSAGSSTFTELARSSNSLPTWISCGETHYKAVQHHLQRTSLFFTYTHKVLKEHLRAASLIWMTMPLLPKTLK